MLYLTISTDNAGPHRVDMTCFGAKWQKLVIIESGLYTKIVKSMRYGERDRDESRQQLFMTLIFVCYFQIKQNVNSDNMTLKLLDAVFLRSWW